MAECNPCGTYLSIEDIFRKSIKCSADGNVSALGALLNPVSAPGISAIAVSLLTDSGFTIGATVNPNGAETTVSIEYGLTDAYGSTQAVVTGSPLTEAGAISAVITGLSQNTLYHYRIKAVNSADTTYSTDATLTTVNAELTTYITGLSTPLSDAQKTKLNTLVSAIKTGLAVSALSDVFDAFHVIAGETAESAVKNLAKNAHHLTAVNSPTFTQFEGYTGNGTSSYLSCNYVPSTNGVRVSQNSDSSGLMVRNSLAANDNAIIYGGHTTGVIYKIILLLRISLDRFIIGVNQNSNSVSANSANTDTKGYYSLVRSAANLVTIYKNGIQAHQATTASTGLADVDLKLLAYNGAGTISGFSQAQLALYYKGRSFSQAEIAAIETAFEAYMDSNGKGIIA